MSSAAKEIRETQHVSEEDVVDYNNNLLVFPYIDGIT